MERTNTQELNPDVAEVAEVAEHLAADSQGPPSPSAPPPDSAPDSQGDSSDPEPGRSLRQVKALRLAAESAESADQEPGRNLRLARPKRADNDSADQEGGRSMPRRPPPAVAPPRRTHSSAS